MLCGVQFVDVLGVTVVTVALPQMLRDLDASAAQGSAVVNAYALFFGGLLMVGSRLGDRLGHRRLVLGSLVLFAAASLLGALAPTVWLLAAARAVQGMAAAASVPAALRLLTSVVPEGPARKRAVAGWSAAGAAAGGTGLVVGGILTDIATWRASFWMFILLSALLTVAVVRQIPPDQPSRAQARIGWPSAVLLTGAAMGLVAGTSLLGDRGGTGVAWAVLAMGLVLAVVFVPVERRARHPLVPPAARRSRRMWWGAFGSFFNTATTSASITVATLYLQDELGLTALRTGLLLVTFSILVILGAAIAPRMLARWGWNRTLAVGLATVAVGTVVLVVWPSVAGIGVGAGLSGLGIGIGSVAATDLGTSVSEERKAAAAGVLNTSAQLGTAIGTALTLLVATTLDARAAWAFVASYAALAALAAAAGAPRGAADAPTSRARSSSTSVSS